jgi:hypothetical protein
MGDSFPTNFGEEEIAKANELLGSLWKLLLEAIPSKQKDVRTSTISSAIHFVMKVLVANQNTNKKKSTKVT